MCACACIPIIIEEEEDRNLRGSWGIQELCGKGGSDVNSQNNKRKNGFLKELDWHKKHYN